MSARRCQVTPAPVENGNGRHSVAEQVVSPEASAQPEPQPAEQLELSSGPELYAGWLRSRAQWRNQWSRRWFIARPGCVEYYTSPEETEAPRAHIPLEGCKLTAVSRTAISLAPSLNGRAAPSPVACLSQFEIVCPSPFSAGFVYRCRRRGGRTALSCWCAARRPRCVVTPAMRCNAGDASATRNELTLFAQGIKGLHSRYILDCESEAAQGAWIAAVER